MNAKQQDRFRQELETKKAELTRVLTPPKVEDHDYGRDEGDRANAVLSKEILLLLNAQDSELLAAIDGALARIANGGFGECLNCEQEIPIKRMEALPWTRYCIVCQELIEEQKV